ncbi:MAG: hypothetical protein KIT09_05250 [Bryobacteraceae bacterium]|nr:hypothetical protein [Bryobacteraceae bacterium]
MLHSNSQIANIPTRPSVFGLASPPELQTDFPGQPSSGSSDSISFRTAVVASRHAFVTFIRVLEAGADPVEVAPGARSGDYLHGFLLGTREALSGNGRESMTITVRRVDARTVGGLIALFERAVGFYATLIRINAYHQPGVQAGKDAADQALALQSRIERQLSASPQTAEQIAGEIDAGDVETVYLILEHLAANGRARASGSGPGAAFATPA